MVNSRVITLSVIVCFLVVGVYVIGEVNYFSSKVLWDDSDSPIIVIPSIDVNEKVNNDSLSHGVFHEVNSFIPSRGDVFIFGHRTLEGSPFLRLNEVKNGDVVILEWPGVGEVNYTVVNSSIVPANVNLNANRGSDFLYLITCDPIGSTENRLVVQAELVNIGLIDDSVNGNNQSIFSWIISCLFLIFGLSFCYFYKDKGRKYVFVCVVLISIFLFYLCIFPYG